MNPEAVTASEARQSMYLEIMDCFTAFAKMESRTCQDWEFAT
jgi:hypothetical protein